MKYLILSIATIVVFSLTATWLNAAPTIGAVTVTPNVIPVNTPTTITVTAVINDPLLLPQSVNLTEIIGATSTVVGALHDDGIGGDSVSSDHIFTARVQLDENYPIPITFQVSAAFTGLLRRATSPSLTVTVQGLTLPTVLNSTPFIAQGTVTSINSYLAGLFIFTDLTMSVTSTIKGRSLPTVITVQTLGGTVGSESEMPPYGEPFAVGQQLILFLQIPDVNNRYGLANGSLGIFRLQQGGGHTLAVIDSAYDRMDLGSALDPAYMALLSESSHSLLSVEALTAAISAAH